MQHTFFNRLKSPHDAASRGDFFILNTKSVTVWQIYAEKYTKKASISSDICIVNRKIIYGLYYILCLSLTLSASFDIIIYSIEYLSVIIKSFIRGIHL